MEVSGQIHIPAALPLHKELMRQGGLQRWSGHDGEDKNPSSYQESNLSPSTLPLNIMKEQSWSLMSM